MSIHPGTWQKDAGAATKYFEELTTELVSGQEAGRWGPGAEALGLEGPVSLADFKALAYGKHPKTGQNITTRQKSNRRAVLEVVASCPKSYSVAAVLGKDERLVALFGRCVSETMAEADRFAAVRVRSQGRDEDAPAKGLVYAEFQHDISRALDPDLHRHIPVFNMAQEWGSTEWRALQTTELFAKQRLFTAILNSKLAAGARELGYAVEKSKNGFELAAIPKHVRDQFSKGSKKIDKASEKLTGKEKSHGTVRRVMAWKTRPDKTKLDEKSLHALWKSEIGGDYDKVVQAVAEARYRKPVYEPRPNAHEIVRDAIERTTQNKAVVNEHEVEMEALNDANGRLGLIEVRLALKQAEGVVFGKPDRWGSRKLTTEKALEAERRVILVTRNGVGKQTPLVLSKNRKALLNKTPQRHRKGMARLISSRDTVIVLTSEKDIQAMAKAVAEQADVVVLDADKGISVAQLDRALAGQQRVLVLASPTKNPSGALRLLLRHSGTTHARCTTLAEAPAWKDIRGLADSRHTGQVLSLLEQSNRVSHEKEAVAWAIANDAVVITPNLAEAEKMTAALRSAAKLGQESKNFTVTHLVALNSAEKRQTSNYKPGMELRGIRGLGLPTKTAMILKLRGNEVELKIGSGPNIIVDLSRLPSSAHWTVHQTQKLEIRTGDKLLLGKTGERVTVAEINNGEPVSDRGFVIPINDSVSYGWAVPETTPVKTSNVAVLGATSRIGLCRALGRGQTEAKLFTSDMLELREKLFSNNKTAGSILQSTAYPRRAINQQRLIEQCWTPAKAAELAKTHEITPAKTAQNIEKTPVSVREQGQGQER